MNIKKDSFAKFIYLSVAFHLAIFIFLTVKFVFFSPEQLDHQRSVRVDVVALPEKRTETPPIVKPKPPAAAKVEKKTPPKPKPKPKPKEKKAPVEKPKPIKKAAPKVAVEKKKVQDEQDSAIARLKALQKLKDKNQEAAPTQEFKGNALNKGNSLEGLEKLHHQSYLDELDQHIRSFWNLPEWLADGSLKASVVLYINKSGGISGKNFLAKSGNSLFDDHVLATLEKANPLPPPPASLVKFYETRGVEIRFP